jgi:hypothetical protein
MTSRRIDEETLTLVDERGRRYLPVPLLWKIGETIVRSLAVVGVLCLIGVLWEAAH